MKDLYHQDVAEMIERETRPFEMWSIESADDPDFKTAFDLLWDAFGAHGEMEREETVREFLAEDVHVPEPSGTFMRYYLIVAKDKDGQIRGVRDGTILINQSYAHDLCIVYLSHIYMKPEARGTVLSYWLRISPVELAVQYLMELHLRGVIQLPQPNNPGRNFGMRINLTAEMEYFAPEDRLSLQRILFYGRGGFDVINPRHFPYRQPDFRPADEIERTGNQQLPFMILLRRIGRERQARLPIEEAEATMNLLYDDFESFCRPEHLATSLDLVLDRLERQRARGKAWVDLLPMPSGAHDLHRIKALWRYDVLRKYYPDDDFTRNYIETMKPIVGRTNTWIDAQIEAIRSTLAGRPSYVYENRDKGFTWEGEPILEDLDSADLADTAHWPGR